MPKTAICPHCEKKFDEYPATSRLDNKTQICPSCGMVEALVDAEHQGKGWTADDVKEFLKGLAEQD